MNMTIDKVTGCMPTGLLCFCVLFGAPATPTAIAQDFYEACYHFIGDYPPYNEVGEDWTRECQGLAHDNGHWFISLNAEKDNPRPQIWKVPVTQDLATLTGSTSGIVKEYISSFPQLAGTFDHYGDLDYYEYNGTGYLVIPVSRGVTKGLVVFRAADLSYVGHGGLHPDTQPGWCAVDRASPEGFVYLAHGNSGIAKYQLLWDRLPGQMHLYYQEAFPIVDENGDPLHTSYDQGEEFTPSGELLYMVTGKPAFNETDPHPREEGIHVFDTRTWRRIKHSTLCEGYFNYCYDPSPLESEEPEGITIWDLDGAGAPGIDGQVHVIVLDNDLDDYDDVWIKHYRGYRDIYVDGFYTGNEQSGTPAFPFRSVSVGNSEAWNGAVLHIRPTCYPEAVTFSRRMDIIAEGGTVIIGPCSN